jgi:predicted nuclease of predicted toxin-antitoxin system
VIAGFWNTPRLHGFILVSTDGDFKCLVEQVRSSKVVILRSCDNPTNAVAAVLRRNSIFTSPWSALR